jgi:hypothetical protein
MLGWVITFMLVLLYVGPNIKRLAALATEATDVAGS